MATPTGIQFGQFMRSQSFRDALQAINDHAVCEGCGAPTLPDEDTGRLICEDCAREDAREIATAVDLAVWDADAELRAIIVVAHDGMLEAERKARRARKPETRRHWEERAARLRLTWQEACALRRTA